MIRCEKSDKGSSAQVLCAYEVELSILGNGNDTDPPTVDLRLGNLSPRLPTYVGGPFQKGPPGRTSHSHVISHCALGFHVEPPP